MTSSPLRDPLPGVDRVAVFGLGRSGRAAVTVLVACGKSVLASDVREDLDRETLLAQLPEGVDLVLGENPLGDAGAMVLSPGIPLTHPAVKQSHIAGVALLSELELGARLLDAPMVAVTGAGGEATVAWVAHLLRAGARRVCVVGRGDSPLCAQLDEARASDVVVLEVSARQLWATSTFSPNVLVATGIDGAHADHFNGDTEYLARVQRRPLDAMDDQRCAVLNAEDPELSAWSRLTRAKIAWFGLTTPQALPMTLRMAGVEGGELVLVDRRDRHLLLSVDALSRSEAPDQRAALAAALAAFAMGVSPAQLGAGLRSFSPTT